MEKVVYRQIAFPMSAFDYLKQFQRNYDATHQARLTNNQALTIILSEHKQINVESEEHGHDRR